MVDSFLGGNGITRMLKRIGFSLLFYGCPILEGTLGIIEEGSSLLARLDTTNLFFIGF